MYRAIESLPHKTMEFIKKAFNKTGWCLSVIAGRPSPSDLKKLAMIQYFVPFASYLACSNHLCSSNLPQYFTDCTLGQQMKMYPLIFGHLTPI
jgi:hypothetical protein